MKQRLICALIICIGLVSRSKAQDSLKNTVPDSTLKQDVEVVSSTSTLTAGVVYANNANYYGQKAAEKMPYIALAAVYRHRSGFYITGMGYRLLNDSVKLGSAYNLGAGFSFPLSGYVQVDISYDYSFYPKLSPFLQSANPHSTNLTLSYERFLNVSVSGDYAFGKTNDIFITPEVSKDVNLFSLGKNDVVSLSPALYLTAGTQHFYEYYLKEKTIRDSLLGLLVPPILGESPSEEPAMTMKSRFELLSYNAKIPLSYNRNNLKLEVSAQFSLLSARAQSQPGKLNAFYGAAFYYQF